MTIFNYWISVVHHFLYYNKYLPVELSFSKWFWINLAPKWAASLWETWEQAGLVEWQVFFLKVSGASARLDTKHERLTWEIVGQIYPPPHPHPRSPAQLPLIAMTMWMVENCRICHPVQENMKIQNANVHRRGRPWTGCQPLEQSSDLSTYWKNYLTTGRRVYLVARAHTSSLDLSFVLTSANEFWIYLHLFHFSAGKKHQKYHCLTDEKSNLIKIVNSQFSLSLRFVLFTSIVLSSPLKWQHIQQYYKICSVKNATILIRCVLFHSHSNPHLNDHQFWRSTYYYLTYWLT